MEVIIEKDLEKAPDRPFAVDVIYITGSSHGTVTERRAKRKASKKQVSYIEISDDEKQTSKKKSSEEGEPRPKKQKKDDDYFQMFDGNDEDEFISRGSGDEFQSDKIKDKKKKRSPPKKKTANQEEKTPKKLKKDIEVIEISPPKKETLSDTQPKISSSPANRTSQNETKVGEKSPIKNSKQAEIKEKEREKPTPSPKERKIPRKFRKLSF